MLRKQTHEECAYFNNGFCELNRSVVNPDWQACSHFIPKLKRETSLQEKMFSEFLPTLVNQTYIQGKTSFFPLFRSRGSSIVPRNTRIRRLRKGGKVRRRKHCRMGRRGFF